MLILTRCVGETLVIGDDVHVTVLSVNGNQVRIGIKAPKHIAVHREEIHQRIQRGEPMPTHDIERQPPPDFDPERPVKAPVTRSRPRSSYDDRGIDRRAGFVKRRPTEG